MNMRIFVQKVAEQVMAGGVLAADDALLLSEVCGPDLYLLFAEASRIREHFKGNSASLCSIINAKSGRCPENCAFCAQSSVHTTNVQVYPLVDEEEIVSCARSAEQNGARCYGIITSGTGIQPGAELEKICG
jgi:biotin synthase